MSGPEFNPGGTDSIERSIAAAVSRRQLIREQITDLQKQEDSLDRQIANWQARLEDIQQHSFQVNDVIASVARVFEHEDISFRKYDN